MTPLICRALFDGKIPRGFAVVVGIAFAPVFVGCLCFAMAAAHAAAADEVDPEGPSRWAILIGVEKYRLANPLQYTLNDVERLAETLRDRGDFRVRKILETAPKTELQPLRESLLAEIPKWLTRPGPEDLVLVYFTGHGFRDTDGKLYLAPLDCDPNNPAATGIAVDWLREQIAQCKSRFKLLVIDACHAGAEKGGDGAANVVAKDLAAPFENLSGVFTLASCTGEEKSLIWDEKQQSLFSYWLNQGLKGHADRDGDGAVTVDELYGYIFQNVPYVAEKRFQRPQTPARIVGPKTPGVEVVIRPKPSTLKGTLDDMAEKLATTLQLRGLSSVGIPEFAVDAKQAELELGVDFGLLGRYCATELEGRLVDKSADKFEVIQHDVLQESLRSKGLALKDLRTVATKGLTVEKKGLSAIALGILRSRAGREITLQCELRGTDRQDALTTAGGTALLNESEWAMLGRSAALNSDDRVPEAPMPGRPVRPISAILIERLDQRSQGPHPLLDLAFPYRVKVLVGKELLERQGIVRGNDWFVPLKKGEVYAISVENRGEQQVLLRLLVDGLNTLPEKPQTKNVTVERIEVNQGLLPAQRVNLAEAKAWLLEPKKKYTVRGFFSRTGADAKYNEFKVADAPDSAAARQAFTDQLGLITAAFYTAKPKGSASRGPIGTALGKEYDTQTERYENLVPGDPLAVVHIRYVEPKDMPTRGP